LITLATLVPAVAFGACGIGDDDALVTLPPIRTTTTTIAPSTTIDTTRYFWEVQSGENMNSIARRFCVPYQELLDANRSEVPDPSLLQVGQMLEIPKDVRVMGCVLASETTAP
jgi:spore germination protein YaaH